MPVRARLTVVFTAGTAVVMAVVSALFLVALRSGVTGNLDTTLLTRTADVVAQLDADPTSAVATESANGILVQVLTRAGTVVDGSDALGDQRLLSPAQTAATSATPLTLDRAVTLMSPPGVSDGGPDDLRVVAVRGPGDTVVAAAASRDGVDGAVRRAGLELFVVSVLLVAVAAVGAWLLARAALRPVESMRRQAAALRPGDAASGIDVPGGRDELARLAVTFNDLLSRLQRAVDREQAFVADAGHELRTPLTVLRGELELAGRPGRSVTDLRATVAVATQETERLVRLSEDLLVLTRDGGLDRRRTEVDLVGVAHTATDTVTAAARARDVTVLTVGDGPAVVSGDDATLRRAVENVLGNAVRFAPAGTSVEVTVTAAPHTHLVEVRDHGPGFPVEFLPRAFDRFTRADAPRVRPPDQGHPHGSGLGLAIVDAIARDHGGTAAVSNDPSGGREAHVPCGAHDR